MTAAALSLMHAVPASAAFIGVVGNNSIDGSPVHVLFLVVSLVVMNLVF